MIKAFFKMRVLITIFGQLLFILTVFSQKPTPDYSNINNWAAHPDKQDPSDRIPDKNLDRDTSRSVDVFFIHPTTFTGKRKDKSKWNADILDQKLNDKTLETTILHQASVFNAAAGVYSPFYRQAHLNVYYSKRGKLNIEQALDFAYQDVKRAFEYYLEKENKGRPIIIAGHSQGTNHAERLLKEFFDAKPLQKKLVAAYLIGMPIQRNTFKEIEECTEPSQTGCFCTWRTFKEGTKPKKFKIGPDIAVTNPLSWDTRKELVPKSQNAGALWIKFEEGTIPNLVGAQIYQGILWTNKPKAKGSFFLIRKNYHIADMNLFYLSIRENVLNRLKAFNSRSLN